MSIFSNKRPHYGQDPFLVPFEGHYLLIESVAERRIVIREVNDLENFNPGPKHLVWHDPRESQVWAPELHQIDRSWYIYYSYSDGYNPNHRSQVLQSTDSPFGPYQKLNGPIHDIWGIDATILEYEGERYLIWSGWEDNHTVFPQNLYGASLINPNEIEDRIKIASPSFPWEKSIAPILEGPQILKSDSGKLFISYSANASWTCEYAVGLLEYIGGPILSSDSWAKHPQPILKGGGHGCQVGDFYVFHKKLSGIPGWQDRVIVSKHLIWQDGLPVIHT